ncbi:MAG: hypothetical protein JWP91_4737 [Fibrobacteres bacterium]|nr:hypothetical protein [Fibrobacterota bacterium]
MQSMHLPKFSNPFKTTGQAGARNASLEGMPLHQRQQALTRDFQAAKQKVDGMKSDFKNFRYPSTPEQHAKRSEYNTASIHYERTKFELDRFNSDNKAGLKAEAKAGPSSQPLASGSGSHQHPTSLIPGHPDSAPSRQDFSHPDLFLSSPTPQREHPTSLIPGHPDSASRTHATPPEITFTPASPVDAGSIGGRLPLGPRPMRSDNSPGAHLMQMRHDLRAEGRRVPEPTQTGSVSPAGSPRAGSPDSSFDPHSPHLELPVQEGYRGRGTLHVTNPDPARSRTPSPEAGGGHESARTQSAPNFSRPFGPGNPYPTISQPPVPESVDRARSHLQQSRDQLRNTVGYRRNIPSPGATHPRPESAESFPMRPAPEPKPTKWYNPLTWGKS